MCTLRPRASAQWLVRGRVSGFRNMRTTHRHIYMIPSEMEVALRYNCITLDTVHTVYTVFILLFFKVSMSKTNRLRVGG